MRYFILVLVLLAAPAYGQGITIPHDPHPVPDFCATSGSSVTSDQTIDAPTTIDSMCVRAGAMLTLNAKLTVTNLLVNSGGSLVCGPNAEIEFQDVAPTDAGQYGTGLIVDGKLQCTGLVKTTWLRLAVEPNAGAPTLTLAEPPIGWNIGDRIVVPDSRHMKTTEITGFAPDAPQWEVRTVAGVAGQVVTLNAPLDYTHPAGRNSDGAVVFLPHVGNLSRSITFRSPPGAVNRGHVLVTKRADVDIRYVRFENLGRTTIDPLNTTTNVAGRYAIHWHHLMGPAPGSTPPNGHQFTFIGNAVDGGDGTHRLKWGMAVHDSHYGLIQGNVFYNWAGAAVMFEDGSESYNVLDGNFAVRSQGEGARLSIGTEGTSFWFKGPNNYVRNNVSANPWNSAPEAAYGFKFFLYYLGNINVPNFKGADTMVAGQYTVMHGNKMPILEFTNNEVYGAAQGLTYWWVNAPGGNAEESVNPNPAETVFKDTKIWHVFNIGVYHYPASKVTFDGLTINGGQRRQSGSTIGSGCCLQGWYGSDYDFRDIIIRNANITGMGNGIWPSMMAHGPMTIENSTFQNDTDIVGQTMWNVGGGGRIRPREITVRNTLHAAWPGRTHVAINKNWNTTSRPLTAYNLAMPDVMKVYSYQGNPLDNFQAYYSVQATEDVAGGLAPCSGSRPGLVGIACDIQPLPMATDIEYLGSFLVPTQDGTAQSPPELSSLSYGGYALGIGPNGTLFYGCHDWHDKMARITNPTPSLVAPFPTAKIVDPCTAVANIRGVDPTSPSGMTQGGSLWWNGRYIFSAHSYYDADYNAVASHFSGASIAALSGPVTVTGSGISPGKVGGGMGTIPTDWRDRMGGPALTSLCCVSIIGRSSFGPSASVFNPDNIGAASFAPATLLFHYTDPNGFKPVLWSTLKYGGLAWPSGFGGLMMMARSGTSANSCYGIGVKDPALHKVPNANGEMQCYDPTNASKGYHSYPYKPVAYVYDGAHLAEVVAGTRLPLNLQPVLEFDLPIQLGTTELTSVVYDDSTRILYAVGARNPPKVHAMRIKTAGTTPPPVPCEGTWTETATLTPPVCDASQQQIRTVTRTFTQTSGDPATCPASPVVTITNQACVYTPPTPTGEIIVRRVRPRSCDIRIVSNPPDASGGWGVQFTLNGVNAGARDTSEPYYVDQNRVQPGTVVAGVWSKSGINPIPFTIGVVVCE